MYSRKSVHFIEPHASWVQIDVNQFGLYILVKSKGVSKTSTQGLGEVLEREKSRDNTRLN